MEFFAEFWTAYGAELIHTAVLGLIGYFGFVLKRLCTRFFDTQAKRDIARTCVSFVEQLFADLHGQDKLNRCMEWMEKLLMQQGISVSEEELRVWIESAVREMNAALSGDGAPAAGK